MPIKPLSRDRTWLFPPTLDELMPSDHPARFVAAFVEGLDRSAWLHMMIAPEGDALGAPSYDPRMLLCVWLYGFMTSVRSTRKLEAAARDQIPYLWLTGWEHPDHNTLWRFYQAHRSEMRDLFKRTVRTAVRLGLVDLAMQAVDGTRVAASAARDRTHDRANLEQLLAKTEAAIADLEAQNAGGEGPTPVRLPEELADHQSLRDQVEEVLAQLDAEDGGVIEDQGPAGSSPTASEPTSKPTSKPKPPSEELARARAAREELKAAIGQLDDGSQQDTVNLTDPDATIQKSRQGHLVGYNAQAMVSQLNKETAGCTGLLITAADVTTDADDHSQLGSMIDQAREVTGQTVPMTLADGGYHSGPNLQECADREQAIAMPEAQQKKLKEPYHKNAFRYDEVADTFTCPEGHTLHHVGNKRRERRPIARLYRTERGVCQACPAFEACAHNKPAGRTIETGPQEKLLRDHRTWMVTSEAKELYRQRKQLPEPTFGILKEQQGARRFLLRGLEHVRAEWTLLATAFNLRTLYRVWAQGSQNQPAACQRLAWDGP